MQKWDYLFIVVDKENIYDPGRPRYVNGQELPNWKQGESIFGVMNWLGWQGWELVSNPIAFGLAYPIRKQFAQLPMVFRRPRAQ